MFQFLKSSFRFVVFGVDGIIGATVGLVLLPLVRLLRSPYFYLAAVLLIPGVMAPVLLWGAAAAAMLLSKIGLGALLVSPIASLLMGMTPFFLASLAASAVGRFARFFISSAFEGLKVGFFEGTLGVFTGMKNIILGRPVSESKKTDKSCETTTVAIEKHSSQKMAKKLEEADCKLGEKKKEVKSIYPDISDRGCAANQSKQDDSKAKSSVVEEDKFSESNNHHTASI